MPLSESSYRFDINVQIQIGWNDAKWHSNSGESVFVHDIFIRVHYQSYTIFYYHVLCLFLLHFQVYTETDTVNTYAHKLYLLKAKS